MFKRVIPILVLSVFLMSCSNGGNSLSMSVEKQKEYANKLKEQGLFKQAVNEFKKLQDRGKLSDKENANISYLIGKIYMDDLNDYQNALAEFTRVKVILPESDLTQEVNTRTIECLERLGKPLDAQREAERLSTINKKAEMPKGTVVAKIRDRSITKEDLDNEIRKLPSYVQEMYKDDSKKAEFLKQFIATELMYDSAKRRNFENDKDIVEKTFQAKKSFMVQKLFEEEMKGKLTISESDLKNYYEAHKKDYVEKDKDKKEKQKTYEEAKESVKQAYAMEKEQEIYQQLINQLLQAEKVTIYEDVFKPAK
jgi:tetratricopeptide (TPR) repeat protein